MITKKIFLASSSDLKEDRREIEIAINRKNKDWVGKGVFLHLVVWEDFLDTVSKTRLQDEYNNAIRDCDIFLMLFSTRVGQYTSEEFETAFGQFRATSKPYIFTYLRDAEVSVSSANLKDLKSVLEFQDKLRALGHFWTVYKNVDELKFNFYQQLDKLQATGFIESQGAKQQIIGGERKLSFSSLMTALTSSKTPLINTSSEVASRLGFMIKEVGADFVDGDYLRIMAYTPIPYFFAQSDREYKSLLNLLLEASSRIELVCLNEQSFSAWSQGFLGKRNVQGRVVTAHEIKQVRMDFRALLNAYNTPFSGAEMEFRGRHPTRTVPIDIFPSFFTYFTSSRALVINVLFSPIVHAKEQPRFIRANASEVVGFETTDLYTIRNIAQIYNGVRHEP